MLWELQADRLPSPRAQACLCRRGAPCPESGDVEDRVAHWDKQPLWFVEVLLSQLTVNRSSQRWICRSNRTVRRATLASGERKSFVPQVGFVHRRLAFLCEVLKNGGTS